MTLELIRVDAPEPVATVVLVHGAWHGAWCWQDGFAQRLAEHGISTIVDQVPFVAGHSMGGGVVQGLLSRADRPTVAGVPCLPRCRRAV